MSRVSFGSIPQDFRSEIIRRRQESGRLQAGQGLAISEQERQELLDQLVEARLPNIGGLGITQSRARQIAEEQARGELDRIIGELSPVGPGEIIQQEAQEITDIATAEPTGGILEEGAPVTLKGITEEQASLAREIEPLKEEISGIRQEAGLLLPEISGAAEKLGALEPGLADIQAGFGQARESLAGLGEDIGALQTGQPLQQLASTGLTDIEREAIEAQLSAVGVGREQALEQIEQTARERGAARGLLSSRGAITEEATGLAQVPLFEATQRAGILGQKASLARSGVLSGTQAISGLVGQRAGLIGAEQGALAGQAAISGQRAGLIGQQLSTNLQKLPVLGFQSSQIGAQTGLIGTQAGLLQGAQGTETTRAGLLSTVAGIQSGQQQFGLQQQQLQEQILARRRQEEQQRQQGLLSSLAGIGSLFFGDQGFFGKKAA